MERLAWSIIGRKIVDSEAINLRFLLLAALLIPALASAEDASFPCSKASSKVELRICNSPYATLKQLDRELANWYKRALSMTQDANALRSDQRRWLQSLDYCLTNETVEPHQFVCDGTHDTNEKTQCFRDFCLVGKYIERTRYLNSLTTQGVAGRYALSNRWPNGIHENFDSMAPEDAKLCKSIEAALWTLGPLEKPLTEQKPISESLEQAKVSWLPVAKPELLSNAQSLERIVRKRSGRSTDIVDSDEFKKKMAERVASGELSISLADTQAYVTALTEAENKTISVLRFQRWSDIKKTTNLDIFPQVQFFRVDNGDLSTAQPIGDSVDAFVIDGKLYFDEVTERRYDDKWKSLPNPQPEIFIYKAYWYDSVHTMFKKACHLLYEQKSTK